jgi:hypothetical protein
MRAAQRITVHLVQEWIEQFLEKNKDYASGPTPGFPDGFENADVLGIQGQFAEIWRKIWKLKKALWDDQELIGEQPREVLLDMIGHCFLAIDMLDRAQKASDPFDIVTTMADDKPVAFYPNTNPEQRCGPVCGAGHTYTGSCKLRRNAGNKDV